MDSVLATLWAAHPATLVLSALLAVAIAVVAAKLFGGSRSVSGKPAPPVAQDGSIPVLSTLKVAGAFGKNPAETLQWARGKYGDVFTTNLAGTPMTWLMGAAGNRAFFSSRDDVLSFGHAVQSLVKAGFGRSALADRMLFGSFYEDTIKGMIRTGFGKSDVLQNVARIAREQAALCYRRWWAAAPVDLFQEASRLVMRINIMVILGEDTSDDDLEAFADAFYTIEDHGFSPLASLFPNLPLHDVRTARAARRRIYALISSLVARRIAQRRRESAASSGSAAAPSSSSSLDYISRWIEAHPDEDLQGVLPPHVLAIIAAAHVNTAGTMGWTVAHLARDAAALQAVRDEIAAEEAAGGGGSGGVVKTGLLDGCMKETVRLYAPPQLVRKVVAKPFEIDGYEVPVGHYVCISPSSTHQDAAIFDDPTAYRPARWLDADFRRRVVERQEFAQFGFGIHRCLGENYVTVLLRHCWATMFSNFDLVLARPDSPLPPPKLKATGTAFAGEPVMIRLAARG